MFTSSYKVGQVAGIPIRAHVTLLILLPIIALHLAELLGIHSVLWGLIAAVGLFVSVALHELGHALVALHKGCKVREILLLPIGGIAQMENLPANARDELHISIAGPAVSLGLALVFRLAGMGVAALGIRIPALMLGALSGMNLMLAIFNLLPSFPMDGGRIFRAWMSPKIGRLAATGLAVKTGRFLAVCFGLLGLINLNLFLIAIAVFVYQAAGAEYRMVYAQEASRRSSPGWFFSSRGERVLDDREVTVSPPPYKQGRTSPLFGKPIRLQRDLFDELFEKWR